MAKTPAPAGPVDLFGNPNVSPRQLMQQQLAALLQETATRTAGADPRTQGVSLMGAGVGGMLGQLLQEKGVLPKSPEMVRAENMEKARTGIKEDAERLGIDPNNDPSGFADLAASHFMRAGDEQSAATVLQWKSMKEAQARQADRERQQTATLQSQEIHNLKDFTPASVQKFRETNDASHLVMSPEALQKGRGQYLTPVSTADGVMAFNTRDGRMYDPATGRLYTGRVVKDTADPALQGDLAGAREHGKKTGGAKFDLPMAESNAAITLKAIDDAIADPALKKATGGFMGRLPALFGEQARGVARIDQLKGGAFLTAYQQLKGGGHITEIEGKKGEDAIARLNRAQTYEDFIAALKDLRAVIVAGRDRARQQAGQKAGKPSVDGMPTVPKRDRAAILKQYGL